jgi:hypothetical protein
VLFRSTIAAGYALFSSLVEPNVKALFLQHAKNCSPYYE